MLWHTIKLEVPKEMVNITKNDNVVVKKSLTKTNNISKANNEPFIKQIPGDSNKPKIISDCKECNIEELKLKMKKAKDLGKKNEGKEYKKQIPKDKVANIITKETVCSPLKKKLKDDLLKLYTRLVIYFNPMLNDNSNLKNSFGDFNKDELLTKLNNLITKLSLKPVSLSQLVTRSRYTRYGRFIRRHLFGLRPNTYCQWVLGRPDSMA